MPKSENQKLKILYIAKYLLEETDEEHGVNVLDIQEYLKENDIEGSDRSIYRDIALLRDEFGMDIDGGRGKKYRLLSREFEFEDLRILAQCVYAAKFISEPKAKELVETLRGFCSNYQADSLETEVFLFDRVKTTQKGVLLAVCQIQEAMKTTDTHEPEKISFQYLKSYINDPEQMIERRKGSKYVVSPFQLMINEGNYYLLAFDDKSRSMRRYRIDRMKNISLLHEPREGAKEFHQIDLRNYTRRVFGMFEGERKQVQIRFVNSLLDAAYERFGKGYGTSYRAEDKNHFVVSTEVEISDQFFGWICGFRKRATILQPQSVVEQFKTYLKDIASRYED